MKLVEIKNNLAKLYYEPAAIQLAISDFLTVDDNNKKILSQVISIESTSKSDTNCAILKLSLDINEEGNFSAYSGYVPSLDAQMVKTDEALLIKIFSNSAKSINIGNLSNTTNIHLNLNASILDNFLYIQSDVYENTQSILSKILDCNHTNSQTTLLLDFNGIFSYENANIIELGKEFKLPIGVETLNYIYENDLTGLTVEQKAIVQDTLLEIQDYTETLDSGYIPFNTLMDVVNSVYESDKSTGVILLRNKLLKYKQFGIFASTDDEIESLEDSVENNIITVLNVSKVSSNWQKETADFIINNLQSNYYFIMSVNDENTNNEILNKIYKTQDIKPIISSSYECTFAQQLKSFAKNLILFRPLEQQKSFATYNSFLTKISQKEFIVSGEGTYYTPLIIKDIPEKIELCQNEPDLNESSSMQNMQPLTIQSEQVGEQQQVDAITLPETLTVEDIQQPGEIEYLDSEEELLPLEEIDNIEEEPNEIKNIFDESLENEIAKDVDETFFANTTVESTPHVNEPEQSIQQTESAQTLQTEQSDYVDLFSEADLDMLDDINTQTQETEMSETDSDASGLLHLEDKQDIEAPFNNGIDNISIENNLDELALSDDLPELPDADDFIAQDTDIEEPRVADNPSGVPIYDAESEHTGNDDSIKISEGNIVYHEKYGRGVVEELFNYGKRTLCSIQFDNVGRRLLDPNLAELKQM